MIIVTGGAGFIGANFILYGLRQQLINEAVINIDKLTYAGNLENVHALKNDPRHVFIQADINDKNLLKKTFDHYQPRAVVHFAAESHVDRSIQNPEAFIETNVRGTFCLLEASKQYWETLPSEQKKAFRFLHISTDEVYGSLETDAPPFTEASPYLPNSPYAASKASSDHLVRAYYMTYGLPVLITHCSNNYGPYQFKEKFIPCLILNALQKKPLPIYGNGLQIRDWLYVEDHCEALYTVLAKGLPGEIYNIGGNAEKTNLEMAYKICALLNKRKPAAQPYEGLIQHVPDRPGHDKRYAIDSTKIKKILSWEARETLDAGLSRTLTWYLKNHAF